MAKAYSIRIPEALHSRVVERGPLSQIVVLALEAYLAPQWTEPSEPARYDSFFHANVANYERPAHDPTCKCGMCKP